MMTPMGARDEDGVFGLLESAADPWRCAFELAWESWTSGSLGIGAVLVTGGGDVVARGRNRVLETGSPAPLSGSLLGHAEMTAFVELGVRTARGMVLYTTVEPCLMCSALAGVAGHAARGAHPVAGRVVAKRLTQIGFRREKLGGDRPPVGSRRRPRGNPPATSTGRTGWRCANLGMIGRVAGERTAPGRLGTARQQGAKA
jgi:Cytidine and deoxycytidylate deaminase zinc-binding region